MIFVHEPRAAHPTGALVLERRLLKEGEPIPAEAVWIDLVAPTRDEDLRIEALVGVSIPTREEMQDIEPSELLYTEDGARYLTARLVCRADTEAPVIAAVTFIVGNNRLVTVRYEEPRAFGMFAQRAAKPGACDITADGLLTGLIESISDRAADVLQTAGTGIDAVSAGVFAPQVKTVQRTKGYQETLRQLGRWGDLVSKQRESLVSVERMLLFLTATYRGAGVSKEMRDQARATLRDLQSLEEHASFLANKIQFLLDATLGLVNLEQNNIIKIFSVVAVIFLPPTLIASIYGMNFKYMPELDWLVGYPFAMALMVAAAVLPFGLFRWRGWL